MSFDDAKVQRFEVSAIIIFCFFCYKPLLLTHINCVVCEHIQTFWSLFSDERLHNLMFSIIYFPKVYFFSRFLCIFVPHTVHFSLYNLYSILSCSIFVEVQ